MHWLDIKAIFTSLSHGFIIFHIIRIHYDWYKQYKVQLLNKHGLINNKLTIISLCIHFSLKSPELMLVAFFWLLIFYQDDYFPYKASMTFWFLMNTDGIYNHNATRTILIIMSTHLCLHYGVFYITGYLQSFTHNTMEILLTKAISPHIVHYSLRELHHNGWLEILKTKS